MQSLRLVSEDQRRKLYEFGEGLWRCAKYLEIKQDSVIGNHYHKLKDECFLLLDGEMEVTLDGVKSDVKAPCVIEVPRNVYHVFKVKAGSRILGLCSELFNKEDDNI